MNSFPNILTQRLMLEKLRLGVNVDISNVHTMEETLSSLRIASNQGVNGDKVYIPEVFIRGNSWSKQNQKILEYLASNKVFQNRAQWVYRKLITQCDLDTWVTGDVKIRIATCAMKCLFDKDDYIYVCDSLIANMKELREVLIDEELPFQVAPVSPKRVVFNHSTGQRAPSLTSVTD